MLPTDTDLVFTSKQSLDCRAKEHLGDEGATLNSKSNSELTSIPNTAPSFDNDPPFSQSTGPSEFLPLPLVLQPDSCSSNSNESGLAGPRGADLTHPPNMAPSAQGPPQQSDFSQPDDPTAFCTLPRALQPTDSGKYEMGSGPAGPNGADLTLPPNIAPPAQKSHHHDFCLPADPTTTASIQESNNSCVAPPLNSQGNSEEVEQLTDWSETSREVSSHNSTPTPSNPKEPLKATNITPKSKPVRPMTRPHCGRCKNCLTYGDNVLNCRGPPSQTPTNRQLTQPQMAPDYRSDRRNVQCYWCHEFGHYASECTTQDRPETRDRPSLPPRCGRCKNCLKHGENALHCRGPPTQSPNYKTRPRCHRCQNCLTYGDNVRNCKGLPPRNLKPTSSRPANNNAIPKGTTTANPPPLAPTSLEYQIQTTLSNNQPTYTNPDCALQIFAKNRLQALSVVPYPLLTPPLISPYRVTGMEQWGRCPPISYPPSWIT